MHNWEVKSQGSESEGKGAKDREGWAALHGHVSLVIVMALAPPKPQESKADHLSVHPLSQAKFSGQVVRRTHVLEGRRNEAICLASSSLLYSIGRSLTKLIALHFQVVSLAPLWSCSRSQTPRPGRWSLVSGHACLHESVLHVADDFGSR